MKRLAPFLLPLAVLFIWITTSVGQNTSPLPSNFQIISSGEENSRILKYEAGSELAPVLTV
ncbi:hypothetical protein LCGC14_1583600 [marine sediment metagenome]|uniref:Uncharacterized protein n=1 Tax=marine sediment metagenome TaxID=412755 RepID=A0A0F9J2B1_9ZZZZ